MDCIVLFSHRQHVPLRVSAAHWPTRLAHAGVAGPASRPNRRSNTHAPLQRFIEAAPYVHRTKKCRHRVTIFPTSAIVPALKGRKVVVNRLFVGVVWTIKGLLMRGM